MKLNKVNETKSNIAEIRNILRFRLKFKKIKILILFDALLIQLQ